MPRRDDIHTILIIGSGPIVIGQGCEFDYSGTQACKALREEGYRVVLVNSNPATIMTDPAFSDRTYIEPITPEAVEKVILKEKEMGTPIDARIWFAQEPEGMVAREMRIASDCYRQTMTLLVLPPEVKPWERDKTDDDDDGLESTIDRFERNGQPPVR